MVVKGKGEGLEGEFLLGWTSWIFSENINLFIIIFDTMYRL